MRLWSPRAFGIFFSLLAVGLVLQPLWTLAALALFVAARLVLASSTPAPSSPVQPGPLTRPRRGPCPGCQAAERSWCSPSCHLLDPADYR